MLNHAYQGLSSYLVNTNYEEIDAQPVPEKDGAIRVNDSENYI